MIKTIVGLLSFLLLFIITDMLDGDKILVIFFVGLQMLSLLFGIFYGSSKIYKKKLDKLKLESYYRTLNREYLYLLGKLGYSLPNRCILLNEEYHKQIMSRMQCQGINQNNNQDINQQYNLKY